jgi:hypothetical protein
MPSFLSTWFSWLEKTSVYWFWKGTSIGNCTVLVNEEVILVVLMLKDASPLVGEFWHKELESWKYFWIVETVAVLVPWIILIQVSNIIYRFKKTSNSCDSVLKWIKSRHFSNKTRSKWHHGIIFSPQNNVPCLYFLSRILQLLPFISKLWNVEFLLKNDRFVSVFFSFCCA